MKHPATLVIATLVCALTGAASAHAQATRTWVSGVGDDVNPCSRTAPCKTFAGAISKTAAGGEISVLDNGSFGAVTITKAITLDGGGKMAGILAALVNAIIINAGANDVVTIRGLALNGAGSGLNGIRYLNAGTVVVDDVQIEGFTGNGIDVSLAGAGNLIVRDAVLRSNTNGIRVISTGGAVRTLVSKTTIHGSATGLDLRYGFTSVSDSQIAVIAGAGAYVASGAVAAFENNVFVGTTAGLQVPAGGIAVVSSNGIYNSTSAFLCGGVIASNGKNRTATSGGSCAPAYTVVVQ